MSKELTLIGLTEEHGMSLEQSKFPPNGFSYKFLPYQTTGSRVFTSPMKGYMSKFDVKGVDAVETVITPILTNKPWFYSLACYQEAVAFSIFGIPIPRVLRLAYMEHFFKKENFKGFLFWSKAGLHTMKTYGGVLDKELVRKSHVVYPAIRKIDDSHIRYNDQNINILFNGNFFIKGGVNLVDSFLKLEKEFGNISLRLLCDEEIDFKTGDRKLRETYLSIIKGHNKIRMGRVPREQLLKDILPKTDIYVLPSYGDAFGYAILEAMAFGIPVVATNYMAIPEMVEHNVNGLLVDLSQFNCQEIFKGCYVKSLPDDLKKHVDIQLTDHLYNLIASKSLRNKLGMEGLNIARSRFSFQNRSETLGKIYRNELNID